jgi:hypothetical protein
MRREDLSAMLSEAFCWPKTCQLLDDDDESDDLERDG